MSEDRCIQALKFCYVMDKPLHSRERLLLRGKKKTENVLCLRRKRTKLSSDIHTDNSIYILGGIFRITEKE